MRLELEFQFLAESGPNVRCTFLRIGLTVAYFLGTLHNRLLRLSVAFSRNCSKQNLGGKKQRRASRVTRRHQEGPA
jgi:hypothetical protein